MATPTKKEGNGFARADRDLLVELRTQMEGVRDDIKDLKDSTAVRLAAVEQNKLDQSDAMRMVSERTQVTDDHETRLRTLEKAQDTLSTKMDVFIARISTWGSVAVLGMGLIEFVLQYWFAHH